MAEPAPRFSTSEVLEILESSPARLAAATSGFPTEELHEPLEVDGWSARDILAHVRACDRTWGGYIERIFDQDHPAFRGESPRSTIRRFDFLTLPFDTSLDGFTTDRSDLMDRLRSADASDLARRATVTLPGRGAEERTAFYYAHRIAEHEREHVHHIERAFAARRAGIDID